MEYPTTQAMASIQAGEILEKWRLDFANGYLIAKGINPLRAFHEDEVHLYHRAIALSADVISAAISEPSVEETQPHPFVRSCNDMRAIRQADPEMWR